MATTDHGAIKRWAEERGGRPARLRLGGLLRIDFWGDENNLEHISWEDFFTVFDFNHLTFLYQENIDGEKSIFYTVLFNPPDPEMPEMAVENTVQEEMIEDL